ncbi:LysR family transcriptional regulator [Aminipila butyrica]|uniref:LysR family transcriptional regulator n=1 Tax=Aminipila butyrica TaxID=433296 RepID=A0A858BVB1_9FIRM|nr:LysR family transcriptional regulator [Aminipila butyrica]QIB68006.1 LysR family transcriptional regulator [Aminipila butyrica]
MELKQLEYLVTAAEAGSFSSASEILYTTPSNVSKVVKKLEKRLQMTLFTRRGTGVCLTAEGEKVYRHALEIIKRMDHIESVNREKRSQFLSVSMNPSNYLSTSFAEFCQRQDHNIISFRLLEGSVNQVIGDVEKDLSEIGFIYVAEKQKIVFEHILRRKKLEFVQLREAELSLEVGKQNPLAKEEIITAQQIQGLQFVKQYEDSYSKFHHLQNTIQNLGIVKNLEHAVTTNSDYALIRLLENTDRAYLTYRLNESLEEAFSIKSIPVTCADGKIYLGYVKREKEGLSSLAKDFLEQVFVEM